MVVLLFFLTEIIAQGHSGAGRPDRNENFDVLSGFQNPPKGYGEVPFYWWQGDTLTKERIEWQLDQLQDKCISSLQINYSHIDSGGISWGLSNPSKPALFTPEWWNLFRWFAKECQKRGMTVSLSDYTLGVGQGFAMDEALKEFPEMNGKILRDSIKTVIGKGTWRLPAGALCVTAYKIDVNGSVIPDTRKNLEFVKGDIFRYNLGKDKWLLRCIYYKSKIPSYDPMHPESGKAYIRYFFDRFDEALPDNSDALNFFFSDELDFHVSGNIWNKYFADEFKKSKGYDIVPYLDALFTDIGDITPKIRMDYNDVMVSLSEKNFFIPVYKWHESRGLIYGCDHGGRGKEPDEFGDYFRTQRWNQGPGSDQPGLSKDIIKAKVAASISHLYNRPRVWLEGFYGSGWGTSSAALTDAIFANYVAGYNLLSLHGLYYSTMGGWWEWAPPGNHFRMPYWNQVEPLMKCTERLSYLFSQGQHVCDVAIIYPTEPVVAEMEGRKSVDIAFNTGNSIYDKGIDFDFIDYESIARAEVKNGELCVSGEKYKVIIVPSMKVIRHSTLQKLEAFKNSGGIVINIGEKPIASEKNGFNDTEVRELVASIFLERKNTIQCKSEQEVLTALSGKYFPNFKILDKVKERPYVMHRKIGNRDVYALYNLPKNTKCFFRSKGFVELWNPWNGAVNSIAHLAKETPEGTEVSLPLSKTEMQLIVFSQEEEKGKHEYRGENLVKTVTIDDIWEFELKPCLDNQWGDFQLPAFPKMLGAQVRQLHIKENQNYNGGKVVFDSSWDSVTCSYGTHFLKMGPFKTMPEEKELRKLLPENVRGAVTNGNKQYKWEDYKFSWRYGVEGDAGQQGYHGLKGKMYDNFIRLGKRKEYKHSLIIAPEETGANYLLYTQVIAPYDGNFELLTGDVKPIYLFINGKKINNENKTVHLKKGRNSVLIAYDRACATYLVFRKSEILRPEKQTVAMCWYRDKGILPFDCTTISDKKSGIYAFYSAPGLQKLSFSAYGDVELWIAGKKVIPEVERKNKDGLSFYSINLKDADNRVCMVVLKIDYQPGYVDGAALPLYIEQFCKKGSIKLGDWSKIDGLKAYSGGACYRKIIRVNNNDLKYKLKIDLGEVVASAELSINGKSAGIRLSPPFCFDITDLLKVGENTIEVEVYNTLSNNYTTIPTRYRGDLKSGLIGPVSLLFYEK